MTLTFDACDLQILTGATLTVQDLDTLNILQSIDIGGEVMVKPLGELMIVD
jgi:hypothetical protein